MINLNRNEKESIKDTIKRCYFCQTCKNQRTKYGKLSGKISTNTPINILVLMFMDQSHAKTSFLSTIMKKFMLLHLLTDAIGTLV
jgi:hypothetical protein